ncbi:MAG: DinB family protein [Bacteroidetes bacterium]|nr:DinB family protein [Bacteroidota bacterium]
MLTVADRSTRERLIARIIQLNANSPAQWGKMSVDQMLKHCRLWEEMALGHLRSKRSFIGRIFGKIALRSIMKDDKPLTPNTPTAREILVVDHSNVEDEKAKWISLLEEYSVPVDTYIIHPFFGKMTRQQLGYMSYKHADHHLRQFNS